MPTLTESMARRAVQRSAAAREQAYADEMARIVDATYLLIERSGNVEPSLRDILRETKLSTQAFYRYFQSKDELFLVLLDDGRRRLVSYLEHRMAKARTPTAKLRAWIDGVLAQAATPKAAARTRPFVVNEARLVEVFPAEQQASIDLLVDQLAAVVRALPGRSEDSSANVHRVAESIYELTFARLHRHLVRRTKPTPSEVDHLVRFVMKGASA